MTYPVLSPQGATIILYAHDTGITLLWRGGPRLVPRPPKSAAIGKTRSNSKPQDDAIMVIDSDDEDEPQSATDAALARLRSYVDKPFFDEEPAVASAEQNEFPEITQTLDLVFGSPIYHMAALPMLPSTSEDAPFAGADILKDKMVVALSGASSEVYLLMVPLTPPSIESKAREDLRTGLTFSMVGNGAWGETLFRLHGQLEPSDGLAINIAKPKTSGESSTSVEPRFVIASHSREASGMLRLWEVGFHDKPRSLHVQPFQAEYLPSPISKMSFNPTISTQLLVVQSAIAVRIYDFSMPNPNVIDEARPGSFAVQGSWQLSLYPPFLSGSPKRKSIIDAAWISHGKAILCLLADGQWGIWNVGGAQALSAAPFGKQASGMNGDAIANFTVSGYVEGTGGLRNTAAQKQQQFSRAGEFVPMTPHTRKAVSSSFFSSEKLHADRGGIVVARLPANGTASGDESVVMWLGGFEHVAVIPAISAFWATQNRRARSNAGVADLFSGTAATRMVRVDTLTAGLMGECCNGVAAIVRSLSGHHGARNCSDDGLEDDSCPVDVVVRGDRRLVVVRLSERGVSNKIGGVVGWGGRRLGAAKRKAAKDRATSAFVLNNVHEELPYNKMFDLSVLPRGALRAAKELPVADDETASATRAKPWVGGQQQQQQQQQQHEDLRMVEAPILPAPTLAQTSGFTFLDKLDRAADEIDVNAEDRDVEGEILNIIELDQTLREMERSNAVATNVFFEDGFEDSDNI